MRKATHGYCPTGGFSHVFLIILMVISHTPRWKLPDNHHICYNVLININLVFVNGSYVDAAVYI